jgi:DNA-directed RNA polymerase subunit RPC12/RpoP
MRPRNRIEKEVVSLSKNLGRGMTEAQTKWVFEKAMEHLIFVTNKKGWCSVCGHEFQTSPKEYVTKNEIECPHCHPKGKVIQSPKTRHSDDMYVQILTTCKDWQVIRYFYVDWRSAKGQDVWLHTREVFQKWCRPGTKMITLGANLLAYPYRTRCPFSIWSDFSVKTGDWHREWMQVNIYPRTKILPAYRKLGFSGKIPDGLDAELFFGKVFSNPFTEMLYKTKQDSLLQEAVMYDELVNKYWKTFRVALRHHFKFDSLKDYLDYLGMLTKLKLDLHNPKYVAPEDWHAMHETVLQSYNRKLEKERKEWEERMERERIERMERKLQEAKEQQEEFAKRIARFQSLDITDGRIDIKPLMSIQEFADEGKAMHHCVFSNEYYLEKDSLILSARIDGLRIETIEVDLNNFSVAQSRGVYNVPSDYHNGILSLMNEHMNVIRRMSKRKRTVKISVPVSA